MLVLQSQYPITETGNGDSSMKGGFLESIDVKMEV